MLAEVPPSLKQKKEALEAILAGQGKLLVAYSGGVDSAFLLWSAHRVLGPGCLGVLADSASLSRREKEKALALCREFSLPLQVIRTEEFENPDYLANPPNRCYFCKHELFDKIHGIASRLGFTRIAYGENADDARYDRPGRLAAAELEVSSPLREAGLGKGEIRELSRLAGLPVHDKAAQPCLSSRIPHGMGVDPRKLEQIEAAENFLQDIGFKIVRLRHYGARALVQLGPEDLARCKASSMEKDISEKIMALGFAEVEIDPEGYRGASLL